MSIYHVWIYRGTAMNNRLCYVITIYKENNTQWW
jgi:hypothetical protein